MKCTKCGGAIRRGEEYVAINRHVEVLGRRFYERRDQITVKDAEDLALYHPPCEPQGAFRA